MLNKPVTYELAGCDGCGERELCAVFPAGQHVCSDCLMAASNIMLDAVEDIALLMMSHCVKGPVQ